jgi:hypothetical protein
MTTLSKEYISGGLEKQPRKNEYLPTTHENH